MYIALHIYIYIKKIVVRATTDILIRLTLNRHKPEHKPDLKAKKKKKTKQRKQQIKETTIH